MGITVHKQAWRQVVLAVAPDINFFNISKNFPRQVNWNLEADLIIPNAN